MATIAPSAQPVRVAAETRRKIWTAGTLTYTTTGLVVLFCWLLWGDFAWAVKDRAIPPLIQLLLKKFGASDTFTSLLFGSLPPALGLILGPVIGYKSDRHRGRWGRRIPFLLFATPVAVLGIVGLAFSPQLGAGLVHLPGASAWDANTCVLVFLALFWMLFELGTVTANSVYGALINDVVPRPLLGQFYGLFRALSLIAGIIFSLNMSTSKQEPAFAWIFLSVGALYGIGFMLMCFKVKEGGYPPHPPMDEGRNIRGFFQATKAYFQECFGNSYYWWFFGAMTLAGVASGPVNLYSVFFASSIHMDMSVYWKCLGLTWGISLVMAYPVGWLADRFHPLRLGIGVLIAYAAVMLWGGIFAGTPQMFAIAFVAHGVVAGTWATAVASMGQRLLPKEEFAQFGSAGGIIANVAWMLLAPVTGYFLDHFHHDYRYTFFMGFALAFVGAIGLLVLHGKFMALGGPDHYEAPR